MKIAFKFCILAMLALGICGNAQAQEPLIHVVVFGDSLTSGYELAPEQSFPSRLQQKLKTVGFSNVEVINMSVTGQTTSDALGQINALLDKQPDIVLVELGNDDARRGINIDVIFKNLSSIVSQLSQKKIYVILLGNKAPASMGYNYDSRFEEIYTRIAEVFNVPLYPFTLNGIVGNPDMNLADGIHPNAKGVTFMMEQIYPLVDAAVRWKWQTHQDYQQWQMQQNQGLPLSPSAPPPDAVPVTP